MADPRLKTFTVTLEIEDITTENVLKRLTDLIEDVRTISFDIREQEEK